MAFPDTPVLDDFNRADADPINGTGIWASGTVVVWSAATIKISGNAATANGAGHGSIRTTASYSRSTNDFVECWCQGVTIVDDLSFVLYAALADIGTAGLDGYQLTFNLAADAWALTRLDDDSGTDLLTGTQAISNGDGFGMKLYANGDYEVWYYNGSTWSMLDSGILESNYMSGPNGFRVQDADDDKLDNIGGGEVSAQEEIADQLMSVDNLQNVISVVEVIGT